MKIISILDTTISDYNIGNQIIMDAINRTIDEIFKDDFIFRLQYAEKFGKQSLNYIRKSDYTFFGGTNSLSSQMNKYSQMGFSMSDLLFIKNKLILFGVGWWQYQNEPNLYTKFFLQNLLSSDKMHSVRDSYTKEKLSKIGIDNVINTSCPTTWKLTQEHCLSIPIKKSSNVLTTLTDYNQSRLLDEQLLKILFDNYQNVFYWVQGIGDLDYINSLSGIYKSKLKIIPPKLSSYDSILRNEDVDYIGTRLHAGIRAIQHKKRALILSIDNRAKEISKDIGLNISSRNDFVNIQKFIESEYITKLKIPFEDIEKWKGQFK